jgi:exopolysaccharide production protein ExoQ
MEGVISLSQNEAARRELPAVKLGISWALIVPLLYYAGHGVFWFQVSGSNTIDNTYGGLEGGGRSSLDLAVQMAIFAVVSILLLTRLKAVWELCWKQKIFTLIPLFALASFSWSQEPHATLNTSVYLGINILFAFYLSGRFSPQRLLQILLVVGTVGLTLSIALSVFIPKYGVDTTIGNNAWRGIYGSKNSCAAMTTFFLAGAFYAPTPTLLARLWRGAYVCLSLVLILMSRSATSAVLVALLLIYVVAVKLLQKLQASDRVTATLLAILLVGSAIAVAISSLNQTSLNQIFYAFGKNSTLTGRTAIWHSVMEAVLKRPLFGYGYMAFWPSQTHVSTIMLENHWSVLGAHNGFLEVWLSLGAIGVALVLFTFARAILNAASCVLRGGSPYLNWFASLVFLALVLNLDESHLMVSNDLLSMLYVIACVGVANGAARIRNTSELV